MHQKLYALTIVAHPDDESYLFAGTALKLAKQGKSVGVVCLTCGEAGVDRQNLGRTKKQMAAVRAKELKAATKLLKISYLETHRYKDGSLDKVSIKTLAKKLAKLIDKFQPEVIATFGPDGFTGHRDHIAAGKAAMAAAKLTMHKPREVWQTCLPKNELKKSLKEYEKKRVHHSHFIKPNLDKLDYKNLKKINIAPFVKTKLRAIKAHKSQYVKGSTNDITSKFEIFRVIKIK